MLIKDKKRLADIASCYADMEHISMTWAELNTVKREMLTTLFASDVMTDIDFNKPAWRQIRNFYATFGGNIDYVTETRKKIEKVPAEEKR
ncbi:MAG: hypothetical protein LBN06_04460 [Prevotellaceae bacterium]|nr:hypothetical protein [Prevotellaceae bacterium]